MIFYWKYWRRDVESPVIQNNGTVATNKTRKFRVIIGKNKSECRQLKCSVLQENIQGAFIFISYASTLNEIVKKPYIKWIC